MNLTKPKEFQFEPMFRRARGWCLLIWLFVATEHWQDMMKVRDSELGNLSRCRFMVRGRCTGAVWEMGKLKIDRKRFVYTGAVGQVR